MRNPTTAEIENSFTYHSPKGDQQEKYVKLRESGKALALLITDLVPPGHEQVIAIQRVEESIMWANKGIACRE